MAIATLTRFNSYDDINSRPCGEMVEIVQTKIDNLISQGLLPAGSGPNWFSVFQEVKGYDRPIKYSKRIWPTRELAEMWVAYMTENNAFECFIEESDE